MTGRILHQQHHPGGTGPVATAFYDNVAVMHFWDTKVNRWHVAVMELYEWQGSAKAAPMLKIIAGALCRWLAATPFLAQFCCQHNNTLAAPTVYPSRAV